MGPPLVAEVDLQLALEARHMEAAWVEVLEIVVSTVENRDIWHGIAEKIRNLVWPLHSKTTENVTNVRNQAILPGTVNLLPEKTFETFQLSILLKSLKFFIVFA